MNDMKKLLYVSFGNASTPGRGVTKKINSQLKVFQRAGTETVFISGYNDQLAIYHGNAETEPSLEKLNGGTRSQLAAWISKHASEFDFAYIRFQFFDMYFERMLKSLKKNGTKIVVEIPTYPYIGELKSLGMKGIPKIIVDKVFQNSCKRNIDWFTSPAFEGEILGTTVLPINNGIDMESIAPRKISIDGDGAIRLLAVASMSPWHGYERVIEGLKNYYAANPKRTVYFDMVGEGIELGNYKKLVQESRLDDKVKFWGRLSGRPLDDVYDLCQIGICALGTYKHNIAKTNALKTLEYLAKGMPVVCDTSEVALHSDHKYRMNVPMDSSPVNIEKLIEFFDSIYGTGESEEHVIEEIRDECRNRCTVDAAMRNVTEYFLQ